MNLGGGLLGGGGAGLRIIPGAGYAGRFARQTVLWIWQTGCRISGSRFSGMPGTDFVSNPERGGGTGIFLLKSPGKI